MLSLKIYLDDCAYDKRLVQLLRQAGHEVTTPVEAGTLGQHDNEHLNERRIKRLFQMNRL